MSRLKFQPPPMHESLRTIPCPPALRPLVPRARMVHTAIVIDPGYVRFLTDAPTRVHAAIVTGRRVRTFVPKRCLDCPAVFTPHSATHVRCSPCGTRKRYEDTKIRNAAGRSRLSTRKVA